MQTMVMQGVKDISGFAGGLSKVSRLYVYPLALSRCLSIRLHSPPPPAVSLSTPPPYS
jgi:hypothetical protein